MTFAGPRSLTPPGGAAADLPRIYAELRALAAFYGVERAAFDRTLATIGPFFSTYAEIALGENSFDVLTAARGNAHALAAAAVRHGASPLVGAAFITCNAVFPARLCGLKLSFGEGAARPTLYVRTRVPRRECLPFVAAVPELAPRLPALEQALPRHAIVHGLGFCAARAGQVGLKVYAVDGLGAARGTERGIVGVRGGLACRLDDRRGAVVSKRYVERASWNALPATARWAAVADFAHTRLGVEQPDLGVQGGAAVPRELKLYVLRVEAPPST